MNNISKTLYIPLYGKAFVSKRGIILKDKKAEEIINNNQFKLKGKAKSKWLAFFMAMRSSVFDKWVKEQVERYNDLTVLHLGCGLDSRVLRVNAVNTNWVDVDFEEVICERKRYYTETEFYRMISADISNDSFVKFLPKSKTLIIVLEGVSMYLENDKLKDTLLILTKNYDSVAMLVDCYTPFAVKMSKLKNPIKSVGVNKVFGVSSPAVLEEGTNLTFVKEHQITPNDLINELKGIERIMFKRVYAGRTSKKLYKLYEYKK